jgi:hypothetical protein
VRSEKGLLGEGGGEGAKGGGLVGGDSGSGQEVWAPMRKRSGHLCVGRPGSERLQEVWAPVRGSDFFCYRFGSGDGERKTLVTRQIAFEPLPASVSPSLIVEVCSWQGVWLELGTLPLVVTLREN